MASIADYSKAYFSARERGDTAGMQAANNAANAIRASQGQAAQVASQDIANTAARSNNSTSPTSSSGGGGYTIGSPAGKDIADKMNMGDKRTASDGSVWTKLTDGSISVNHNGQTYNNAYKSTPTASAGGGSPAPTPTAPANTDWASVVMNQNAPVADKEYALKQRAIKEAEMRANGTWNNSWIPTEELRSQYMPQPEVVQQPMPTQYTSDDINALLDRKYAEAQKLALAQSAYAVQQGKSDLNSQLQQQLPSYQSMREQSAANTQTDLDNLALRSALQGNRGGIGERQYGVLQASGQDRLLQINLEQKNLEQTAAKQIADLEAQGRFQDAQTVASLAQSKIGELIAEAQNLRNININQEQFNKNFGLQEANLTGYYGGQRTLSGQQFDFSKDTTLADMFGSYNGQQTLAGKQLDFQMSQAERDWAAKVLEMGYTDAQLAQAMGIPLSAAQQIRSNVLASNAPRSSGGGSPSGSGSPSGTTNTFDLSTKAGLDGMFKAIRDSGMSATQWLRGNGAKYGIKTEGAIGNYASDFEGWNDTTAATPAATFGVSYDSIWKRARDMFDAGKSQQDIIKYLDAFGATQLSDAGLAKIIQSLNLGKVRGK